MQTGEEPELERIYFHIPPLYERFKELGLIIYDTMII
jgi:hypothetical protein|eukprot:COSAG06_NODE_1379_length_9637_cov_95.702663_5_plen_37_part_00